MGEKIPMVHLFSFCFTVWGCPVERKLPLICCPVLIIRGGRDPLVPQRWVERVARLIPQSRLVIFSNAAHAVNFDSPEELVAEILKFQAEKI